MRLNSGDHRRRRQMPAGSVEGAFFGGSLMQFFIRYIE
jgi:hypothetical protein